MTSGCTCAVSVVVPLTAPRVAEIVVVPDATAVARPEPLIVATAELDDAHVTCDVTFCMLPSEYVPVAVNCWVAPTETVGEVGVTAIELNVGAVMVTPTAVDAAPRLPLSSAARASKLAVPDPLTVQA